MLRPLSGKREKRPFFGLHGLQVTHILLAPAVLGGLLELGGRSFGAFTGRRLEEGAATGASHLGLVLAAVVAKLACSGDDIIWLLPFVSVEDKALRNRNRAVYLLCVVATTALAAVLSLGASAALDAAMEQAGSAWSSALLLELVGGVLLGAYGLKLFYDHLTDGEEEEEARTPEPAAVGREEEQVAESGTTAGTGGTPQKSWQHKRGGEPEATVADVKPELTEQADAEPKEELGTGKLVCICVLGSLDDLIVQASVLVSGTFHVAHLFTGVLLGGMVVLLVCAGAGLFRPLLACVEKVPLFVIVGILSAYCLINVLVARLEA